MPFVQADDPGRLIVLAMLVYAGDPDDGTRVVDTFRALANRWPSRAGAPSTRLTAVKRRYVGAMFALRWKTLSGSHLRLRSTRRSNVAAP